MATNLSASANLTANATATAPTNATTHAAAAAKPTPEFLAWKKHTEALNRDHVNLLHFILAAWVGLLAINQRQ